MTREEADQIQSLIDEYIAYRDGTKTVEPEPEPEPEPDSKPDPDLESEDPEVRAAARHRQLRNKFARSLMKNPVSVMKMRLVPIIESLLPKAKVKEAGGLDILGVFGALGSALGINLGHRDGAVSVVDGHEDVEPEEIGWDEFERIYCIKVPGELIKEAMNWRLHKDVGQMMIDKQMKEEGE